jgi:A/G-specific adenine glycosylase
MSDEIQKFKSLVYDYYKVNARFFAWRETDDPYRIMVSEIMLQQTQTQRVVTKYEQFIVAFPDFATLAQAPLRCVLQLWQGLGYNRRGMYLQKAAQQIVSEFNGILPDDPQLLQKLHGIGPNTAGSIVAFAYNRPVVFIETNIRTVFLHHFFQGRSDVHDRELMPLIAACVDHENPRHWYYALMDYGVMLKKNLVNPSRRSRHHAQQSKFEGSERQIRGMIVKLLTEHQQLTLVQLQFQIDREPLRVQNNLAALCAEGLVKRAGNNFSIAS